MLRQLVLAAVLLGATTAAALCARSRRGDRGARAARQRLGRRGEVVRIGDLIDNAGTSARIAVYRAPDLGTTGSLPTAQVLEVLRSHQVIGVDTGDIKEVQVTRLARMLESKDIEQAVAHALEHKNGLGDAANLSLTFDRDVQDLRLDASNSGAMQPVSTRFDQRSGRFDITFEIANDDVSAPTRLRFTGRAIETVEAAVLTRDIERNDVLKASRCRGRTPRQGGSRQRPDDARSRRRHAGAQANSRWPGLAGCRSRQARSGAARPERHPDLRGGRALSHHPRQGAGYRHRRRRRRRPQPAIQAHGVRRRDRPRPGFDFGGGAKASRCARRSHLHDWRGRAGRSSLPRRQQHFARCFQTSHSKTRVTRDVQVRYQPPASHHRLAGNGRRRKRMLLDQPSVADRRAAETVVDRQSDGAARLQAGADADAEAGSGVVQRQLAVAKRLAVVLQGPARASDRRPADGHRQHHRPGQLRQRDPAQPDQHRRLRHHRLPRRQFAGRRRAEDLAGTHPHRQLHRFQRRQGLDPAPGKPARPTSPPS